MPTRKFRVETLHPADRQTCPKCGRRTFVCAICGERFHSAGVSSVLRTDAEDNSPIHMDFATCGGCFDATQRALLER
jgi:hypothetical protein